MVTYLITNYLDYQQKLSEDEFNQLKTAKRNLLEFLFIEEKLELILANYLEIERESFNISLNSMMFCKDDWSSYMDEISILNLKIVNFLSTTRLYLDQSSKAISLIYEKDSNQFRIFQDKCKEEYDSNLSYRAMTAIRNHVQHYDLPVHELVRGNQLIGNQPENFRRKNYIQVYSKISTLNENEKFKKSVLNELQKEFGEKVDLILLIRQYLVSLGKIHVEVRNLLENDSSQWEKIIIEQVGKNEVMTAFVIDEVLDKTIERTDFFCDFITRRKKLQDKNCDLTHYSFHFISNETK